MVTKCKRNTALYQRNGSDWNGSPRYSPVNPSQLLVLYYPQLIKAGKAGTYTATVWVKGSGTWNWSALELNNGSTTLGSMVITPSSTWMQVTISNITVAQGTNLTLDVWANANANSVIYIDDFSLVKN